MSAAQHDFLIEQGATFKTTLTYTDNTGTAIDLTGYSARMQARANVSDVSPVINLSVGSGIAFTNPTSGQFDIEMTASETAALNAGQVLKYDLELESPAGVVIRLLRGTITVDAEVTR